jgi:hypothetical protein
VLASELTILVMEQVQHDVIHPMPTLHQDSPATEVDQFASTSCGRQLLDFIEVRCQHRMEYDQPLSIGRYEVFRRLASSGETQDRISHNRTVVTIEKIYHDIEGSSRHQAELDRVGHAIAQSRSETVA